jgi:exopolyphosphatase/guanosine-5'-triphosphate,3'-diphosphate pyrophosphatase
MSSLAALDLGSNTFRLILAEPDHQTIKTGTRRVWQELPRLSEGLVAGGRLAKEPLQRAWEALESFHSVLTKEKPARTLAGATMAFRLAADGSDFLSEISHRYGWETRLLSGEQEARLSALGVLSGLKPPPSGLIFDIGGQSTEFINTRGHNLTKTQSLKMGVVSLTESFIHHDPPLPNEVTALKDKVLAILSQADWSAVNNPTLLGTAGTVTTVAAMLLKLPNYDPELINQTTFHRQDIERLSAILTQEPVQMRLNHPGLHPKRADVIVAGILEVAAIMDYFSRDILVVSDNSLLEGLWLAANGIIQI